MEQKSSVLFPYLAIDKLIIRASSTFHRLPNNWQQFFSTAFRFNKHWAANNRDEDFYRRNLINWKKSAL